MTANQVVLVLEGFGDPVYVPVATVSGVVRTQDLVTVATTRDATAGQVQHLATVAKGPAAAVVTRGVST